MMKLFENGVKMYGTQTQVQILSPFENDVRMYGTQIGKPGVYNSLKFENDV